MKPLAAAALLSLAVQPSFASAETPATIRGIVYSCTTGAPVAGANVLLRAVDGASLSTLRTDARGAFVRVGVEPGRYVVFVGGPVRDSTTTFARPASRLAGVDTGDVLDVRLGTQLLTGPPRSDDTIVADANAAQALQQAEPLCDAPLVPRALQTSVHYVVH